MRLAASFRTIFPALALVALASSGCGRAPLDRLAGSGEFDELDGSLSTDGPLGFDGGDPFDIGPFPDSGPSPEAGLRDTGIPRDGGFPRDGSPGDAISIDANGPECQIPRDCFDRFGRPPPCPDGRASTWGCFNNGCAPVCNPGQCSTDCECPFELACIGGACQPAGRNNQCCFNPTCPAGEQCIWPDGQQDLCPTPFDAGIPFPDGGPPPADGGAFPDGGPPPFDGGGPTDGGGVGTPCMDDCQCDAALACVRGQCRPAGRPNTCTSNVPVGAACMSTVECNGGFCIDASNGFPDGYCTQQCGGPASCPMGAVCRNVGGGNSLCLDACNAPGECRPGYNCIQLGIGAQRVCWPIPPGSTNPNGDDVGSACASDQTCDLGLTCMQQGFPGGYCTQIYCDPQTNPCPTGSQCYAFPGLFSMCLDECPSAGTQSTCRRGYYCLGPTGQSGVCVSN